MPWRPAKVSSENDIYHVTNQLFRETNGRIDDINKQLNVRRRGTAELNFGSIAAGHAVERIIRVPGAHQAGVAHVSPAGAILNNSNLIWSAYVSGKDQVTVRLANPTAGAITPNVISWNAFVLI